jgi:hypothetical protein
MQMRRLIPAGVVLACLALSACSKRSEEAPPARANEPAQAATGGALPSPPAASAATAAPRETRSRDQLRSSFGSVDEAEKALDRAKGDLDALLGGAARGGLGTNATPLASGDPRCPEACKAMSSLRRAADAVCRLAGPNDARCSRAKEIVGDSEKRVAACKCEAEEP